MPLFIELYPNNTTFCSDRFSYSTATFFIVVHYYLFPSSHSFSSSVSCHLGNSGRWMEWSRCLVGPFNRFYDVSIGFFLFVSFVPLSHPHELRFSLDITLQNPFLEITTCNLLLGYTTISGFYCFSWYIWEQIWSGSLARFLLGSFLKTSWTFRFVSS